MRIMLLGAGAMGTIIGALISEAGHDIELADKNRVHINALNEKGAQIIGNLNKTIPVKAILPEEGCGTYDLILSMTKHNAIVDSLREIKPFTTDKTLVLTLQNGLPEEKAKEVFSEEKVLSGSMEFSATFVEPGVSELASDISTLGITFGALSGEITKEILEIEKALSSAVEIKVSDNIRGVKWTKLTDNSCFSGLPTALGCKVGKVLDDDCAMRFAAGLGKECAQVIRALGVAPAQLFGLVPSLENLGFETEEELQKVISYWKKIEEPFRGQVASMLQDLQNGRKCEIQSINGQVVRMGKKVGIATPFNDQVVEIITQLQEKNMDWEEARDSIRSFCEL